MITNDTRKRQRRQAAGALVANMFGHTEDGKANNNNTTNKTSRPSIQIPPKGIGPVWDPNPNDVLCGRGGRINAHVGNVQFREIVQDRKKGYLAKETKKLEKAHIAAAIVKEIRSKNPSGSFLKEESDGGWYDIGDAKAIKKVGQALREDASDIRGDQGPDEEAKPAVKSSNMFKPPQQQPVFSSPPVQQQAYQPIVPQAQCSSFTRGGDGTKGAFSGAAAAAVMDEGGGDMTHFAKPAAPSQAVAFGRKYHVADGINDGSMISGLNGPNTMISGMSGISALTDPFSTLSSGAGRGGAATGRGAQSYQAVRASQLSHLREQWAAQHYGNNNMPPSSSNLESSATPSQQIVNRLGASAGLGASLQRSNSWADMMSFSGEHSSLAEHSLLGGGIRGDASTIGGGGDWASLIGGASALSASQSAAMSIATASFLRDDSVLAALADEAPLPSVPERADPADAAKRKSSGSTGPSSQSRSSGRRDNQVSSGMSIASGFESLPSVSASIMSELSENLMALDLAQPKLL